MLKVKDMGYHTVFAKCNVKCNNVYVLHNMFLQCPPGFLPATLFFGGIF